MELERLCERSGEIAREEKERSGRPALGTLCSYAPVEILHSFGILPVRLWGQAQDIQAADVLLQPYICPPVRQLMALGLEGRYAWLDGIVHCYTCDATCGLYNIWVRNLEPRFSHLVSLPYMAIAESQTYARAELEGFIAKLESFTGRAFSGEELGRSMVLYEQARSYLGEAYRLKAGGAHLSYADLYHMNLCPQVLPIEAALAYLKDGLDSVREMLPAGEAEAAPGEKPGGSPGREAGRQPRGRGRRRILLSGSVVSDTALMAFIEECGGDIVADDTCLGYRLVRDAWEEGARGEGEGGGSGDAAAGGGDPLDALIRYYLRRTPCASRADFPSRKRHLLELLDEFDIDAVIFVHHKFCDPHLSDHPFLKEILAGAGVPGMQVELEEGGFNAQVQTRIESFFETMGAE
ncbi:MAG: 2-hydroxyacyl-CoA dehydratase [Actinobacteria bacterium]|nr:2-hydroxyacyl-CoA dehydratase [Actinomycetota bacterium]